ncbi:glutamate 5-kinase [Flocculibacter collagenilyticus]|uniref:glutamate 5-kinase n=1 Tax=Flocculibacter collagenilyticus TaxID=2744479 RepID=UPI0018F7CD93|nr:glutamate 5-kinase [Flocculibacter collagenilyticus]
MELCNWQRAVIKIGSALIAPDGKSVSAKYLLPIARFITDSRDQGKEVILVSSGSVAAGRQHIATGGHPPSLTSKQAMAAVGQTMMMANWTRFFDFPCAQILITHGDLRDRRRYVNIKNTLRELLTNNILPIVNENDSVATEELKVGDNDNLAALVALVSEADALFICSDIDGVYNADPRQDKNAQLIPVINEVTADIHQLAGGTTNKLATGGMKTKIQAAEKATTNGINTMIVNGENGYVFDQLSQNKLIGTWFKAQTPKQSAKKHWLKHTLKATGKIHIDDGASKALLNKGASLLCSGIVACEGNIEKGDAVDIVSGNNIGRGISQFSASEINKILGKQSQDIATYLGYCSAGVVVHRDDLVLT